MSTKDSSGKPILTINDWAKLYETPQTSHQWKEGRSAYSVAEFILNRGGTEFIANRASQALGSSIAIERIVPEFEVRFDEYGRGRMHDLGVFAKAETGESIFIGVEAKVDESFGATVLDTYLDAKAKQICGASTNAPERIEKLLAQHFAVPSKNMFDVRYQLLYATTGTLAVNADRALLYVLVFRTTQYNETKSAENYRDYVYFMELVGATSFRIPNTSVTAHKLNLDEKELVCIYESYEL